MGLAPSAAYAVNCQRLSNHRSNYSMKGRNKLYEIKQTAVSYWPGCIWEGRCNGLQHHSRSAAL